MTRYVMVKIFNDLCNKKNIYMIHLIVYHYQHHYFTRKVFKVDLTKLFILIIDLSNSVSALNIDIITWERYSNWTTKLPCTYAYVIIFFYFFLFYRMLEQ